MKYIVHTFVILLLLIVPVRGLEYTAPSAPQSAQALMPEDQTFGNGLVQMMEKALTMVSPDFYSAIRLGLSCIASAILISLVQTLGSGAQAACQWVGALGISALLLENANTMIRLSTQTIMDISEYGKLLLPVMTAAMAAQGGIGTSGALYAGTSMFSTLLNQLLSRVLLPVVHFFLAVSVAASAADVGLLKNIRDGIRGVCSWCLKTILIVFTTYMSITGVVSGTTDAAALKATKVTISTMVPVVGGILSDASEAILVSAALARNAAGIYGIFAILAVFLLPFLKIGVQYLVLKVTAGLCGIFDCKAITGLINDFSNAMGMLLAMTGAACLLYLISTICFIKGVT